MLLSSALLSKIPLLTRRSFDNHIMDGVESKDAMNIRSEQDLKEYKELVQNYTGEVADLFVGTFNPLGFLAEHELVMSMPFGTKQNISYMLHSSRSASCI
jgi:hypothetical protein